MERIKIDIPIVVEGKYDRERLEKILDAQIIRTDGFAIFNSVEKVKLIKRLSEKKGIIVLTDSDGGGLVIRNYFNSILPREKLIHLYIPKIKGVEKRKKEASKEGYLGVEGMGEELLRQLFEQFKSCEEHSRNGKKITKLDFYSDGLSGGENSSKKRDSIASRCGLPEGMSANALLEALNLLYTYDEYKELLQDG